MQKKYFRLPLTLAGGFFFLSILLSQAQVVQWTAGTGSWDIAGNWTGPTTPPLSTSIVTISNSGTARLDPGVSGFYDRLTFGNGAGQDGFLILNGGTLSGASTFVGNASGGSGTVTVNDGTWNSPTNLYLGWAGSGTLAQHGGSVTTSVFLLAGHPNSQGTFTMDGGSLTVNGKLYIGAGGQGSATLNGGTVQSDSVTYIATDANSHGTLTVNSGTWTSGGTMFVGHSGTGTLNVDGGTVNATALSLGEKSGSTGTVTVDSGLLSVDSIVTVGNIGTGDLHLNGGVLLADQVVEGSSGTGSLTFNGGTLRAGTNENNFLFDFEAGDVTIAGGGATIDSQGFTIGIGTELSGSGALTKTGSGTLTLSGNNSYTGGTTVAEGTLSLAHNQAAGSGAITTTGSVIDYANGVTIANPIVLNSNSTQLQVSTGSATQSGVISEIGGARPLEKIGGGGLTLSGNNSFSGGMTLSDGTLVVNHNNALGSGALTIADGTTLASSAVRRITNDIVVQGDFNVFPGGTLPTISAFELDGNMDLGGSDRVITNTMNFGAFEFGQVNIGGVISNGGLSFADDGYAAGTNAVFFRLDGNQAKTDTGDTVVGTNVSLALDKSDNVTALAGDVTVGSEAVLAIVGHEQIADTSTVHFLGNGQMQVGVSDDITETIGALTDDGSGLASIDLNNTSTGSTLRVGAGDFSGTINDGVAGGTSLEKFGPGTLILSGNNTYLGDTDISSGTLLVNGSQSGSGVTTVESGATLGGSGTLSGPVVVADGGYLAPGTSPGTLNIGDLSLNANSQLDFELDTPGVIGGGVNDLVSISGDLILDGFLNITDLGGFGVGSYRLFDYSGNLTDNGTLFGNVPGLFDLAISTATAGQVNLNVSAATAQFWDGSNTTANGVVNGGTGTWDSSTTNWTNPTGVANAAWAGTLPAVFSGSAGTVTIANGFSVTTPGLDFQVDGYTLAATGSGQLLLNGSTFINTATGETTISAPISGSGGIVKQGGGDLTLSGANTYTGATTITDGRLRAGTDGALSATSAFTVDNGGVLRLDGSTQTIGSLAGEGVVRLNQWGSLDTGADNSSTEFSGRIRGNGDFGKIGAGTQVLSGANDYSGLTVVNGGVLKVTKGGSISKTTGMIIGEDPGESGILSVNGNGGGASVTVDDGALVGLGGSGVLRVKNGGLFTTTASGIFDGALVLGFDPGSDGTLRVRGAGSQVNVAEALVVGGEGEGTVRVFDGGYLENQGLGLIGTFGGGSEGKVTVTGTASVWKSVDDLVVGAGGKGILRVLDGGTVQSAYGAFVGGIGPAADGTATVSGTNSLWSVEDFMSIGGEGAGGTLNILDGGRVTTKIADIGSYQDDTGTVNVDGPGSVFEQTEKKLIVGFDGDGTLNLSNGGLIDQSSLPTPRAILLAKTANSKGTINIGADPLNTPLAPGLIDAIAVRGKDGDATLNFHHTGTDYFFTNNGMAGGSAVDIRGSAKVGHYAGTTTLTSRNNYSGGTTIEGGTLRTSHRRALGTGPVILNGGSLDPTGRLNTGPFTWNAGTVASDLGATTDFINVNGDLVLTGPGNFDFAAGTGFSNNRQFRIFNADNMAGFDPLSDFAGNPLFGLDPVFSIDGENLFVNYVGSVIVAGTLLQNSGPVNVPNFADFILTGNGSTGTATENNTINSLTFHPNTALRVFNTLTVTSGRFTVNGGSGTISGGRVAVPGNLTKEGAGKLILNDAVNVAGATLVRAGALVVNGTLTTGGGLTVFQNGLLGGSGLIHGSVLNGGTVNPGNSPGTLTILGNYTQTPSGTLQIEIASPSVFDRLVVSGEASLAGTLQAINYGGNQMSYGQQFAFLQAGSISGDFDEILMPDPARFRGRFLADNGVGSLLVAPTSYTLVAQTANQHRIAKALDSYIPARGNDRETVSVALDLQSEAQYPAAFDAISPAYYGNLTDITIEKTVSHNQMLAQRMSSVRLGSRGASFAGIQASPLRYDRNGKDVVSGKDGGPLAETRTPDWSAWVQASGIFAKLSNASQLPSLHFQTGGVLAGVDRTFGDPGNPAPSIQDPKLTVGAYTGYDKTWTDYQSAGSSRISSALFGAYATFEKGGFYADTILGGGHNDYRVRRPIAFSTIDRTARGTPYGGQFNAYQDIGYDWQSGGLTFGLLAGAQYTYAGMASFSESGAESLDLQLDRQRASSIRANLGGRIAYTWELAPDFAIIPELRVLWQHEFLEDSHDIDAALDGGGGASFAYQTGALGRDNILVGTGVSARLGRDWSAYLYYNANFARKDYLSHTVSTGFEWRF